MKTVITWLRVGTWASCGVCCAGIGALGTLVVLGSSNAITQAATAATVCACLIAVYTVARSANGALAAIGEWATLSATTAQWGKTVDVPNDRVGPPRKMTT